MRITAAQRIHNENRIRAAMDRLLRGEISPGGNCDIKTLALSAGVDRTAFYGTRPYAHLRAEFEHRLQQLQQAGETPDPKTAQIERLKTEVEKLKNNLAHVNSTIQELTNFRSQALPGSLPSTTRSFGSARPTTRRQASPASRRIARNTSRG